ncbi:hypothetical protein B5U78_04575 [Bifidobacterium longum]|nr:hypothetical protein B5U78_04575 [Bifidobacterium longum]
MIICLRLDNVNIIPASLLKSLLLQGFPGRFANVVHYWSHYANVWHYVHQAVHIVDEQPSTLRTQPPTVAPSDGPSREGEAKELPVEGSCRRRRLRGDRRLSPESPHTRHAQTA